MASLNFNHLRYFWAVAHEGNLTRAAKKMALSQSALSVQLQKLEHQLGCALFERQGKRLALTEAGRIALDYANTVFEAGEELTATLKGHNRARQTLRVGAVATFSRNFQLEFLRTWSMRDDVDLIVRSGSLSELLAQLETHDLDVVLANRPVLRDARSPWQSELLAEQAMSLVGQPGRAADRFRFPDGLRDVPLLLPSQASAMRGAFDRLLEKARIDPVIKAEVDDMAMLRLLAREHRGLTLVPPIVVRDELQTGVLVEYCRVPGLNESFYAITLARRFPNPLLADLKPQTEAALALDRP
jgi:LysR family transcriptional activator of nhaA